MRRILVVASLFTLIAASSCTRSGSQGRGIAVTTTVCGMLNDPARDLVYVGDTSAGKVVALSATSGDATSEVVLGDTLGGLALDHCFDRLYVSVTGGRRIDVVDCETFKRASSLSLSAPPYAIAPGTNGHLLVVTGGELVDLDPASLKKVTMLSGVETTSLLCSDQGGQHAWLGQSKNGEITVSTFDLAGAAAAAAVTSTPGSMIGKAVGFALSFAGDKLYVASDGAAGVYVLDAVTLQTLGTIDLGPGLSAMATNVTCTRMSVAHGGALAQSVNLDLDVYAPGADVTASANVRERGLVVAPNNASLIVNADDNTVVSYPTFGFRMDAATAMKQGHDYTLTLDGTPDAQWLLFLSAAPGYAYIDPPTTPDPRFLDLSVTNGFLLLANGSLDPAGHAELSDTIPLGTTPGTFLLQAVEITHPGKSGIDVSNPLVVRVLGPECP